MTENHKLGVFNSSLYIIQHMGIIVSNAVFSFFAYQWVAIVAKAGSLV